MKQIEKSSDPISLPIEIVSEPVFVPPIPKSMDEVEKTFGSVLYRVVNKGGDVSITNNFVRENLVKVDLPIVGERLVHKLLVDRFGSALEMVALQGKSATIHHAENGRHMFGTFAARLKRGSRTLSLHSFGIACDINWSENRMGNDSQLDPAIIAAFKSQGFAWGGDWAHPDPMHFEYYVERKAKKHG